MNKFTLADEMIRKNEFDVESYKNAIDLANQYWLGCSTGIQNEYMADCTVIVGKMIE